jgi:hypothetical protein
MPEISEPSRRPEQPCSSSRRGSAASSSRRISPEQSFAEERRRRARAGAHGTNVWSTRVHPRPDPVPESALRENPGSPFYEQCFRDHPCRVDGPTLQKSSQKAALPDYASWLRINLACTLIMRCVHRPVEEISFHVMANFDNDLAERRLSTLRRRSFQRDMSSAPQVAGNSGLFLERRISTREPS